MKQLANILKSSKTSLFSFFILNAAAHRWTCGYFSVIVAIAATECTGQSSLIVPESDHANVAIRWRRRLLIAGIIPFVVTILLIWASVRRSSADREIERRLSELRASGEPVSGADLAARFPDPMPPEDAALLYAGAMQFVTNHPLPGNAPIVITPLQSLTEPLDERTRRSLQSFYENTVKIGELLPRSIPENTRFPMRWNLGMTNFQTIKIVPVRALVQMLVIRAIAASEAGDPDDAATMLAHGFRFTGCVNREAFFVAHMVHHACNDLLGRATEFTMNRNRFSGAQLQRISEAIIRERPEDFADSARVERCLAIWAFSQARRGANEHQIYGTDPKSFWFEVWDRVVADRPFYRDHDYLTYLESIPRQIESFGLPVAAAMTQAVALSSNYEARVVSDLGIMTSVSISERVFRRHAESAAQLETLLAVLSIERFRFDSNQIPRSWDDLAPRYLPAPPVDPFDNTPLKLKVMADGYAVYSIGSDLIDDGGTPKTNAVSESGYDLITTIKR